MKGYHNGILSTCNYNNICADSLLHTASSHTSVLISCNDAMQIYYNIKMCSGFNYFYKIHILSEFEGFPRSFLTNHISDKNSITYCLRKHT